METLPKLFVAIISITIATIVITVNFDITPMQIAYIITTDLFIAIIATAYSNYDGYNCEMEITTFLFYFGIMTALSITALWRMEGIFGQHFLLGFIALAIFLKWLSSSDEKLET